MHRLHILLIAGVAAAIGAACAHPSAQTASSGDVVDSLSATRTALLRVQNNNTSEIRVYSVIGGKLNYIAKAMPGEIRTVVLDPNLFPTDAISFETRAATGSGTSRVGPFKVNKGEMVELVVPDVIGQTRATVHRSMP